MNISAVKLAFESRCAVFSELDDMAYARDYALRRSMKHMKLFERDTYTGSMNLMRHMDGSARNGVKAEDSTAFSNTTLNYQ